MSDRKLSKKEERIINASAHATIVVLIAAGVGVFIGVLWLIGTIFGSPGCVGNDCLNDGADYQIRGAHDR